MNTHLSIVCQREIGKMEVSGERAKGEWARKKLHSQTSWLSLPPLIGITPRIPIGPLKRDGSATVTQTAKTRLRNSLCLTITTAAILGAKYTQVDGRSGKRGWRRCMQWQLEFENEHVKKYKDQHIKIIIFEIIKFIAPFNVISIQFERNVSDGWAGQYIIIQYKPKNINNIRSAYTNWSRWQTSGILYLFIA